MSVRPRPARKNAHKRDLAEKFVYQLARYGLLDVKHTKIPNKKDNTMYVLHEQLARAVQADRLAEAKRYTALAPYRPAKRRPVAALLTRRPKLRKPRVAVSTVAAG